MKQDEEGTKRSRERENRVISCEVCGVRQTSRVIRCYDCRKGFHMRCLIPPLKRVPAEGEWVCGECTATRDNHRKNDIISRSGTPGCASETLELVARLSVFDGFLFLVDGPSTANEAKRKRLMVDDHSSDPPVETVTPSPTDQTEADNIFDEDPSLLSAVQSHREAFSPSEERKHHSEEEEDMTHRLAAFLDEPLLGAPGSDQEKEDLSKRLSAFDQFLFLAKPPPDPEAANA